MSDPQQTAPHRTASQEARERPWYVPYVIIGISLIFLGFWAWRGLEDALWSTIGYMAFGAAIIALVGIVLTFFGWGRAVMGIAHRPGARIPFVFSTRGFAQALMITGLFGLQGAFSYTMEPQFCNSCHIMVPYFTAWHESTHKGVECIDCHFAPGLKNTIKGKWQASSMLVRYLTRTYGSKPHAQIEDASCLRSGCHTQRLLEGKVQWDYKRPNGAVVKLHFDHAPHLGELRRGRQLRCVSCHSQIVQGEHISVTLDTCFVCHFKGMTQGRDREVLAGCGSCHGAPSGKIRLATGFFDHAAYIQRGVECHNCHSDAFKGNGEVPRQVCINCHNRPEHVERYGESNLMHDKHVTEHKLRCTQCHMQIAHHIDAAADTVRLADTAGTGTCIGCHQSMHNGPAELYRGVGGRGVPDMPSPMYRAQVDCVACHQIKEHLASEARIVGQTWVAAQKACNMCHGDDADPTTGKYANRLAEWKRVLDERLDYARKAVASADEALKTATMTDIEKLPLARKLSDARQNVALVELGHGVHNFNYSVALLSVAQDFSRDVSQACGQPRTIP